MLLQDGETKHWIIPNGVPGKNREKRIAVEEGYIYDAGKDEEPSATTEDRYGAGTSELWDRGDCEIVQSKKFKLVIKARGEKLRGNYLLFVPDWGRWTKRRLWVVEKIRGDS